MKYKILFTLAAGLFLYIKVVAQPTPTVSGPNPACGNASGYLTIDCGGCTIAGWEDGTLVSGTGQVFTMEHQYQGNTTSFQYNIQAPGKKAYRVAFYNPTGPPSYSRAIEIVADAKPVGGTLSTSVTVGHHIASGQLTLTGATGTLYWVPADLSVTGNNFTVSKNTEIYARMVSGSCDDRDVPHSAARSNSVQITVYNPGTLAGPVSVVEGEKVNLSVTNSFGNFIRWEYSTDGTTWTNFDYSSYGKTLTNDKFADTHEIWTNTQFRLLVDQGPYGSEYTNMVTVVYIPYTQQYADPANGRNNVREQTVTVNGIADTALVNTLTSAQKHEAFTYMDGKGRAVQTNVKMGSPLQYDLVSTAVYDRQGRQGTQYLPFVSALNDGKYKSTALTNQASFYSNGTADKVVDDAYPYATTVFEKSPLGKITEQGSVGQAWQPGGGHSNVITYSNNDATDQVRLFASDGSSTGFYNANDLSKLQSTDADQKNTQKFIDKAGRTILTRVQLDETVIGVANGAIVPWLETYYIYNEGGGLKYMISPKGVDALKTASWILSASILDQYTYQYVYDSRGRVVEKKVPGQGWVYQCYDRLDRLVLVQDANTRSSNSWLYIKYDRKGRPVIQGLYTNATYTTRSTLQTNVVDPLYALDTDPFYEERGVAAHGYTNQSFPTANTQVLTVNYYDNYDFDNSGTDDYAYAAQGLANENTPFTNVIGMPTGSKRLVLDGGSNWLYNYVFYDDKGHVIQSRSNNHLNPSAIDNLTTAVYDFEGKPTIRKTYHNAGAGKVTTVVNKFSYDNMGRITMIYQNNNNAASDQLVAKYEYNELGQVVDKKLHETVPGNNTFLQSVDMRYSIQGWLTSINNAQLTSDGVVNDESNDYFGMEFLYASVDNNLGTTAYFNGNVSAVKWKGAGTATGADNQHSYKYMYDKTNRLTSATSQIYTSSANAWTKETGALNESMTYDLNGNIQTLRRHQRKNLSLYTYRTETIDSLIYAYNPSLGDQLRQVTDATSKATGFDNGASGTSTDYTYDVNGNLLSDLNKGISNIVYNYLNKPTTIVFTDGRHVDYVYDAVGTKLTMKAYAAGGTLQTTTDYVGGFVYTNNTLSFFSSPEGRVVNNSGTLEYQYSIADHQGNTRVVFSAVNPTTSPTLATFEDAVADGQVFKNVNTSTMYWVSKSGANNTSGGQYVMRMNSTYPAGPAKSLKVFPGDAVDLEVWSYYEGSSGFGSTNESVSNLITTVAYAFGGISGGTGESGAIYTGVNSAYTAFGSPVNQGDGAPTAHLNYILFDKDYNLLDMGWQAVPATANMAKQKISFSTLNIKEAGYMYVYLSYEGAGTNWVYFDDLKITHTKTNVVQYNEYYPFGLQANSSWTRDNTTNNFLYNEASEINTTTNWYDLPFRNYDPALGRFMQVDPMASKYASLSPYHYSYNNPVMLNDPSGADSETSEEFFARMKAEDNQALQDDIDQWMSKMGGSAGDANARQLAATYAGSYAAQASRARDKDNSYSVDPSQYASFLTAAQNGSVVNEDGVLGFWRDFTLERIFCPLKYQAGGGEQQGESTDDLRDVTKEFYSQLARTEVFYYNAKKMMDEKDASFEERLYYFKETIGHGKLFDIKQPGMGFHHTEIGLKSKFNGNEYDWDDYGNINFGLAAKTFGISLNWAKFGAGMQQVFGDGDGSIDWSNFDGFFDEYNDTKMIKMGYDMKLPWQK